MTPRMEWLVYYVVKGMTFEMAEQMADKKIAELNNEPKRQPAMIKWN